jgi:predicted TIM-barrel fold metal-dependent hydrolase
MSGYRTDGPEAFRPVGETDYVVASDPDGFIAGIVGFADLTRPEVGDVLAAHVEAGQGRFRGIRHASAWDASPDIRQSHTKPPPHLLAQPEFHRGFAALGAAGLSFDAWMYHPQLPELVSLCRAIPETPVILDHLGGPLGIGPYAGRRAEVLAAWREAMTELATCDNVVVKLGGIGMAIYGMHWHREGGATPEELVFAWGEPVRWCIEAFGADRCMFESNFPVDKQSCTYADLWAAFDQIVAGASPTERDALFSGTATRAYCL